MTFTYGSPGPVILLAMFGWPLVVFALFALYRARTAALWSLMIGALFLPEGAFVIEGLPEYTKQSATSLATLLASILLDRGRPFRGRLRPVDLGILLYCFGRIATSVSNDLGAYDGISQAFAERCSSAGSAS